MSRRGFTLIELMVSIALSVIVLFFLYRALDIQRTSNETALRSSDALRKRTALYELLYTDLMQAKWVKTEPLPNRNYSLLFMQTTNSLHQIPQPYVVYFVHEKNRTLVRLESAYELTLPIDSELVKYVFSDRLLEGVQKFVVLEQSLKQNQKSGLAKKRTHEYLLFLKWPRDSMLIDIQKE